MIRNVVCKITKYIALAKDQAAYKHVRECNCYYKIECKHRNTVPSERRLDKLSKSDNDTKENTC